MPTGGATGFAVRLREARQRAGLTQAQLSRRSGVSQPKLSAYERGVVEPKPTTADRILRAARPRPSLLLEQFADEIIRVAHRHRIEAVRVFGSAVHGTDTTESDVDLLVSFEPGATLLDAAAFELAVEELLGYPVDLVSDDAPRNRILDRIIAEAVPL